MITAQEMADRAAQVAAIETKRSASAEEECRLLVEMGQVLSSTKASMAHGQWLPWVEGSLPLSPRAAQRAMRIAANATTLAPFFPMGKCAVLELVSLPAEVLSSLSPDSVVDGKRLRDLPCHGVRAAVSRLAGRGPKATTPAERARRAAASLTRMKVNDPEGWEALRAEVSRLLGEEKRPCEERPLAAATRDDRGREAVPRIKATVALIQSIAQGTGEMTMPVKAQVLEASQLVWRAAGTLPANPSLPPTFAASKPA